VQRLAILLCVTCAMPVTPAVAQADTGPSSTAGMNLQTAVALAVQHHPSIGAALATAAQQADGEEVAKAGYRPQVRAGLEGGRLGQGRNARQMSVTASQMLYDFGKVDSAVAQASAGTREQRAKFLLQVDDVARDAALALVEVNRFQQLEGQAQALVDALGDIVRLTQMRAKAGATSQADPMSAQARLDAAQAGLLGIRSQLRQQRTRLSLLTGAAPPQRLDAPAGEALRRWAEGRAPDLASLPAIQAAQAALEASEAALAKSRAQQMPTISLEAGSTKTFNGMPGVRSLDHSVMLSVSGSLYQGGALAAQARSAAYGVQAARATLDNTRLEWQERQEQLAEQASGLQQRLLTLDARQQALQATRPLYREQYLALGTRSVLDLLNNEQEISQAMADRANAQHDLWDAQLAYLHATGQLRQVFGLQTIQGQEPTP